VQLLLFLRRQARSCQSLLSQTWPGKPQIALVDALGSNVVNIALVLAIALTISGIRSRSDTLKRDFPVAVLVPVSLYRAGQKNRFEGNLEKGIKTVFAMI
jgi:Ca2+/Na+ antiporter